jgi:hypothetical protein
VFPSTALPRTIPANKCSPANLRPNYSPEFTSPNGDSAYRTSRRTILCFPIRASLTTPMKVGPTVTRTFHMWSCPKVTLLWDRLRFKVGACNPAVLLVYRELT